MTYSEKIKNEAVLVAANLNNNRWDRARVLRKCYIDTLTQDEINDWMQSDDNIETYEDFESLVIQTFEEVLDVFGIQEQTGRKAARLANLVLPEHIQEDEKNGFRLTFNEYLLMGYLAKPPSRKDYDDVYRYRRDFEKYRTEEFKRRKEIIALYYNWIDNSEVPLRQSEKEERLREITRDYRKALRNGVDDAEALLDTFANKCKAKLFEGYVSNPEQLEFVLSEINNKIQTLMLDNPCRDIKVVVTADIFGG